MLQGALTSYTAGLIYLYLLKWGLSQHDMDVRCEITEKEAVSPSFFFFFFFNSFLASETLASILYRSGIFRGQSKGTCSVQSTGEYGWTSKGHLKVAMAVVATF